MMKRTVKRMILMLKIAKEDNIEEHFAIFDIITFTLLQTNIILNTNVEDGDKAESEENQLTAAVTC